MQFGSDGKMTQINMIFKKGDLIGFILENHKGISQLKVFKGDTVVETINTNLQGDLYPLFSILDSPGKISFVKTPTMPKEIN